jgi:hypothetical protein
VKAELKVPGALMQDFHQFDGRPVEVGVGAQGFAPPTLYIPVPLDMRKTRAWNLYFGGYMDSMESSLRFVAQDMQFRLTHMREYDDTLVYELIVPRIVD